MRKRTKSKAQNTALDQLKIQDFMKIVKYDTINGAQTQDFEFLDKYANQTTRKQTQFR